MAEQASHNGRNRRARNYTRAIGSDVYCTVRADVIWREAAAITSDSERKEE
jgi:hypothetical protein